MKRKINYKVGDIFGRLTIISQLENRKDGSKAYLCVCECGKQKTAYGYNLGNNHTISCGCLQKERAKQASYKHGKTTERAYHSWAGIKQRCLNPNHPFYSHYGKRGITVCKEWLDFETFYKDMGSCPNGMSIDRINNNDGYYKENCRWANQKTQTRNTRTNKLVTHNGITQTVAGWAEETGTKQLLLGARLRRGMNIDGASRKERYSSGVKGEKNHSSKLTYIQVSEIKSLLAQNIPIVQIAKKYNVSNTSVYYIKIGRNWA